MINQISLANTFFHIITSVASLITISNTLTDGPSINANTELILTRPGTALNVRTNSVIAGNLTIRRNVTTSNINITGSGTPLKIFRDLSILHLITSGYYSLANVICTTFTMQRGNVTFSTLNVSSANIQSTGTFNSLTSNTGTIAVSTANISSLNISSGTLTQSTLNVSESRINVSTHTLTTNSTIASSNVSNTNFGSNTTITAPIGLTKANVGLSNVDDTSDAQKNVAVANLSNKTFVNTNLILEGTVSANPTLDMQIASKQYVYQTLETDNPIHNQDMIVWQRGYSFPNAIGGQLTADRWEWDKIGSGNVNITRSNTVPTVANAGVLFIHSLQVTVNGSASLTSGDFYTIRHKIEGTNWKSFAEQYCTLSFWVRGKAGVHAVALRNAGQNRSYVGEYTINQTDTWEYKSISIPPSPTEGTWNYTTGIGLILDFPLGVGATAQTTSGSWQTGNFISTPNTVNEMDTVSNSFLLVGIKLEKGNTATRLQPRHFEEELRLCQRYFCKSFRYGVAPAAAAGANTGSWRSVAYQAGTTTHRSHKIQFPTRMRLVPSVITFYNPITASSNQARVINVPGDCTNTGVAYSDQEGFQMTCNPHASTAIGHEIDFHWAASSDLT